MPRTSRSLLTGILIPVKDPPCIIELDGSLESFQKHVGGYIECLNFPVKGCKDQTAYVNEDGIALGLPRNELGTKLCFAHDVGLMYNDFIKGPMLIFGPPSPSGNTTSVCQKLIRELIPTPPSV